MKYHLFTAALATFFPTIALAQNPQYTNCHSLELAGYVIGSDEVLVDGKVCKVAAPTTNGTSSTAAPATATEKNKALLGIIEPEVLRAKVNSGANPPSATQPSGAASATNSERSRALLGIVEPKTLRTEEKPGTNGPGVSAAAPRRDALTKTNATNIGAAPQQPEAFVTVTQGSLGDIARSYRKSAAQATEAPQTAQEMIKASALVENKVAVSASAPASVVAQPVAAPKPALPVGVQTPKPTAKQEAPAVIAGTETVRTAPTQSTEMRAQAVSATASVSPSPNVQSGQAVVATTSAPSQRDTIQVSPAAASAASASKTETTLPFVTATQPEVSSAPTKSEQPPIVESELERERAVKTGEFVAPKELPSPGGQPESADSDAEISAFREGQTPGCRKNISLGSMKKDNLFLAIPDWALGWYVKNQKKFPGICFSNALMPGARNYLVVFYTADPVSASAAGTKAATAAQLTSAKGQGGFTTSYGSMWHYISDREVTTTITSVSPEKAPHNQQPIVYAMAYTEQGIPVAQHWPPPAREKSKEPTKKPLKNHEQVDPTLSVMADLLGQMVEEIAKQ